MKFPPDPFNDALVIATEALEKNRRKKTGSKAGFFK